MKGPRLMVGATLLGCAATVAAQVPDVLNALDAGTRSAGAGQALTGASSDTFAGEINPAGLGYVERGQVQYAQRNLPTSQNLLTGSFDNPSRRTRTRTGETRASHIGVAVPMSQIRRGAPGAISLSFSIGGYLDDESAAPGVLSLGNGFGVDDFRERREAKQDFYTLAYGRTARQGYLAYGFGITVVRQNLNLTQTGTLVDANGQPVGGGSDVISFPDVSANGTGIGLIAGVQYTSPRAPDRSYWASLRTPIQISSGGSGAANLDRIPGRLLVGAAQRFSSPLRRRDDYVVLAAQLQGFFGGSTNRYFDRSDASAFGVGLEYVANFNGARLPVRVGYNSVRSGGRTFGSRQGLTYGIGFTPANERFSLDFTYFQVDGSDRDFALTATYRF